MAVATPEPVTLEDLGVEQLLRRQCRLRAGVRQLYWADRSVGERREDRGSSVDAPYQDRLGGAPQVARS